MDRKLQELHREYASSNDHQAKIRYLRELARSDSTYYDNDLNELMAYDVKREKWLSVNTIIIPFGRNGNTAPGAFFRSAGGCYRPGIVMPVNSTIVGFAASFSSTEHTNIEITVNGDTIDVHSIVSNDLYKDMSINIDIADMSTISTRNSAIGNSVGPCQLQIYLKTRAGDNLKKID